MHPHKLKRFQQKRRRLRVRRKITGDGDRPRLSVFRSSNHTYAQIINDAEGRTLVSASTLQPDIRAQLKSSANKAAAQIVGEHLGAKAKEQGIKRVAFDRGQYKYHGRIQALAEAVRKAGVEF